MSNDYQAARIVGALPPPAGVTPNFVDPPSQDAVIIAVHTVFLTLSTLFVSMRVLLRAYVLRSFGWDDGKWAIYGANLRLMYGGLTDTSFLHLRLGEHGAGGLSPGVKLPLLTCLA